MTEHYGTRMRSLISGFRDELAVYRTALQDARTPWAAKVLLGAAIAYVLSPIDLVPDFIPVLGHLDDLVIVPMLVWLALRLIPAQVLRDARKAVRNRDDDHPAGYAVDGGRVAHAASRASGEQCSGQEPRA